MGSWVDRAWGLHEEGVNYICWCASAIPDLELNFLCPPRCSKYVLNTLSGYVMKQLFRCRLSSKVDWINSWYQGFTPRKVAEPVSILQGATTSPEPFFGAGLPLLIWIHIVFPFGKPPARAYARLQLSIASISTATGGEHSKHICHRNDNYLVSYIPIQGYPILLWPHRWAFLSSPGHLVEYLEARDTVVEPLVSQAIAVLRN